MKNKLLYLLILSSALILSGCIARTYSLTRERIDQDITAGNRGYLFGKAPIQEKDATRKENRTVRVFEVELGKPYHSKGVGVPASVKTETTGSPAETTTTETELETTATEATVSASSVGGQKYIVEKNDTLQKISQKFYGTSKKWMKIYNANKDVLKGPNSVYPGQALNIPDAGQLKPAVENLKEPKENLK